MELNVLGLWPRTFNCQLKKVKRQIGYTFYIVKWTGPSVHCAADSLHHTRYTMHCAFFVHARQVYWDLTLPLSDFHVLYYYPWYSLGCPSAEGNTSLLVRYDQRMTSYGKALGLSWWLDSLGRSRGIGTSLGTPFTMIPAQLVK